MYSLENKVVLITGAGSGIGRALANLCASKGARLALADWDESGLDETAAQLSVDTVTEKLDVADRQAVEQFAQKALAHFGQVDVVVNNAGVALLQKAQDMRYQDLEWLMNINFWGVVYGTHAVLPHMVERGSGCVVNISSLYGQIAWPGNSAYCAAKFAVRGYTEVMTQDLKGTGVNALSVHPGGIQTNIVRNARFSDSEDTPSKASVVASFDKIAMTTAESAAKQIVKAIEREKVKLIIGQDAKLLDRIQRVMPVSYRWFVRWLDGVAGTKNKSSGNLV